MFRNVKYYVNTTIQTLNLIYFEFKISHDIIELLFCDLSVIYTYFHIV